MIFTVLHRHTQLQTYKKATIKQKSPHGLSHCASLSTQHVWLSGFPLCRPNSLEQLSAWWT